MKNYIVDALENGKKVRFFFNKSDYFTANILIDQISDNDNYILVTQAGYGQNVLINLNKTDKIHLID